MMWKRPRFKKHEQFIKYYNNKRVHMSLKYMTPKQVYNRSVHMWWDNTLFGYIHILFKVLTLIIILNSY